ncbi:hypothetical protein BDW60DRAFT_28561 [Aspergillus nidulans var. acristatus]
MADPTFATVPVKVKNRVGCERGLIFAWNTEAFIDMIPFEQTGLPRIRQIYGYGVWSNVFQSLLVVQQSYHPEDNDVNRLFKSDGDRSGDNQARVLRAFNTYSLSLVCSIRDDGVDMELNFDSQVLQTAKIEMIGCQLEYILHQLCTEETGELRVQEIKTASAKDLETIWGWNANLPTPVKACMHDLISQQACHQPEAPAVHAWDGDLSYRELDDLSPALAYHLIRLGLTQRMIIPRRRELRVEMRPFMVSVAVIFPSILQVLTLQL